MTGWRAVVPLNLGRDCKTRLAGRLSRAAREQLVDAMARHVVAQLAATRGIARILLLAPLRPDLAGVDWVEDKGRGLNAELAQILGGGPVLVIHADLPLLAPADVGAMVRAATASGSAIAPDRTATGTNALALAAASGFAPCFGEGSFDRHRALLPDAAIVTTPGLESDIDTPGDLDLLPGLLSGGATSIADPI